MWITIKKALKKGAVVFWPGSEVKIEGHYPSHYLPYDRSLSFEKRNVQCYSKTILQAFWPLNLTKQVTVGIDIALIHRRLKLLFIEWIMSLDICWKVYEIVDC